MSYQKINSDSLFLKIRKMCMASKYTPNIFCSAKSAPVHVPAIPLKL